MKFARVQGSAVKQQLYSFERSFLSIRQDFKDIYAIRYLVFEELQAASFWFADCN
jgi:hypothetical protein